MSKTEIALLNAKGAGKAVAKLIDVVSAAIGRVYTPFDKVFNAYADSKADNIRAIAAGTLPISVRAAARVAHVEERRQENIEQIVAIAASELPTRVSLEAPDPDWMAAFFDDCKDIGNCHMQQIWAKILAGEVASPSSFSRRTLTIVQAMTKGEAESFTRFGSALFELETGKYSFVVPSYLGYEFIRTSIATAREEVRLKDIGLLSGTNLNIPAGKAAVPVTYFKKSYELCVPSGRASQSDTSYSSAALAVKHLPLTDSGNELMAISGATASKGFLEVWGKDCGVAGARVLKAAATGTKRKR